MMEFAEKPSQRSLRLLVLHDDKGREFDYVAGAERVLEQSKAQGWTVISIKNDWKQYSPTHPPPARRPSGSPRADATTSFSSSGDKEADWLSCCWLSMPFRSIRQRVRW